MEILFAILVILGVITLLGHGIWVVLAAFFRAISGSSPKVSSAPKFCIHCGGSLSSVGDICPTCHQSQTAPVNTFDRQVLNDLAATERQLQRFQQQGVLDALKFDWLMKVVRYERQRLQPGGPPISRPDPIRPASPEQRPPEITPEVATTETPVFSHPEPEKIPVPIPPYSAPQPRKSVVEMLTGFMEENNIRWGEIIGGLLIIGCSLALVISFWSQIEQIPLLKFFIFTAMTGAFAGLGFYSEHRWKLPYTSRGLLITTTMLTPLNFLAMAAFSNEISPNNPIVIGTEIITVLVFAFIVYRAGSIVTPGWASLLTIGVVGPSVLQLLTRRIVTPESSDMMLSFLTALPLLCYYIVGGGIVRHRQGTDGAILDSSAFTLFGAVTFATVISFGFVLFKAGHFFDLLRQFAPLISLLAIPALVIGIEFWRQFKTDSTVGLIGSSVSLIGVAVMCVSLLLAWPEPGNLIFVGVINFAALTVVAFAYALPQANLLALPCLTIAYVIGLNLAFSRINPTSDSGELILKLFSAFSGSALAGFFVPLGIACEMLYRRNRKTDGLYYLANAAIVGALSLLLVSIFGFGKQGDPQHITWIYLLFSISAFYVAYRFDFIPAGYVGLTLALLASIQSLVFIFHFKLLTTLLIFATAVLLIAIGLKKIRIIAMPGRISSLIVSSVGAYLLLMTASEYPMGKAAWLVLWIAGLWAALSWLLRSAILFTVFQFALAMAALLFVSARRPANTESWAEIIALVTLGLAWVTTRLGLRNFGVLPEAKQTENVSSRSIAAHLLYPVWPTGDQIITWLMLSVMVAIGFVGMIKALGFLLDRTNWNWNVHLLVAAPVGAGLVIAILAATFGVGLWNKAEKYSVAGLYWSGLAALAVIVAQFQPSASNLAMTGILIGAGYTAITSILWLRREPLSSFVSGFGIEREARNQWLIINNEVLVLMLTMAATIGNLTFDNVFRRLLAGVIVMGLAAVLAMLSREADQKGILQKASLLLSFGSLILCGWSILAPLPAENLLARIVVIFAVAVSFSEGIGLWFIKKFDRGWNLSAKQILPPIFSLAGISLVLIFALEFVRQFSSGKVDIPLAATLVTGAILLGLCVQAIIFAINPQRDPWGFSERGRRGYVYAAEGLLALSLIHFRLTMPWLFGGFFQRYWPLGILLLAFIGVGLGELFRRRNHTVLAEPLHRTGFFLPLLPSLAFWLASSQVDYSSVLILAGALYAGIAVMRRSILASFLACLAANGALWHYLNQTENYSLIQRPQLWLAPLGLSVLGAAYFNRTRLSATRMVNLRYIALMLIYVSSTAEIFLHGVANSPWQPMILMILSVAGVLLGILLRVRAFLYLGSSFLVISILTMVWQAAANFGWTWLWYVTGIVLGLAIILLFAMFEKKRAEFLRLVEGLKSWEA